MPSSLKLVTGNPGRRPIEKTVAPAVEPPPCPDHLTVEAKAEWSRIVPKLLTLHLLAQVDMVALAMYCQAYGRWAQAERKIAEAQADGKAGVIVMSPNGYPIMSPWLIVANKAMEQCKSFLVEFGMTPSARSRIGQPSPQLDLFDDKVKKSGSNYFT